MQNRPEIRIKADRESLFRRSAAGHTYLQYQLFYHIPSIFAIQRAILSRITRNRRCCTQRLFLVNLSAKTVSLTISSLFRCRLSGFGIYLDTGRIVNHPPVTIRLLFRLSNHILAPAFCLLSDTSGLGARLVDDVL